jgi:hypothetical protein
MPAVAGNAWTMAVGKQVAKGTPQTTPTYKLKAVSGDVTPRRDILTLAETDASRQAGAQVVVGAGVEGTTEHYLRPDEFGLIAYMAMGGNADTGTGPNYTHTATAAASAPYATLFKAINVTSLVDRYADCRIGSLTVRGATGGALTYSATWMGLTALLGSTDPVLAASTQTPLVYPNVTVTKGGSAASIVDSFEITINQNPTLIQGDTGLSASEIVWGRFEVSGTMSILFESDADYRAFHTGTTGGTSPASTIFAEALTILAEVNANLSVSFVMTEIEYTDYPVASNTDGTPIRVSAGFRAKPQATIANTLSIVTKNTVATY